MGNFERLSVLVIVVIIVLIVVIALVQLTENNEGTPSDGTGEPRTEAALSNTGGSGAGTAGGAMNGGTVTVPGPRPDARATPPAPGPISIDRILNPDRPPPLPPGPVGPAPAPTPTPTPVVDAPKPPESKIHVVQPGDTMQKLAKVYFPGQATKGLDLIQKANPAVDPARMRVGTKLTIPALDGSISATMTPTPGGTGTTSTGTTSGGSPSTGRTTTTGSSITPGSTYVVKKGDTLASIGRRAYAGRTDRWQDIWLANYEAIGERVDDPEPGTRLTIPK